MRAWLVPATLLAACSSSSPADDVTCGPGTVLLDHACVPVDAGVRDAAPADGPIADASPDAAIDAAVLDAPADAAIHPDEATAFAVDPAHDNAQPADTIASPLTPAWTASFDGTVLYPLVAGGLVIVSVDGSPPTIRALDVRTGAPVWGPIVFGQQQMLAYDEGRIFALDHDGYLTALDLVTGAQRWVIAILPGAYLFSPPVATSGTIYIDGPGSSTSAYDEQTGALLWKSAAFNGSAGCPAVSGGVVYETGPCDEVFAWSALTGAQLWSHAGTCTGGGGTAPSVFGAEIWQRDDLAGNVIYSSTGTRIGTFASDAIPAFAAGKAFYQASGTVRAVTLATNAVAWTFTGDGQICTSPVIAGTGGQVFVGSRLGKVYELDESTGAQRSVHDVGSAITCFDETHTLTLGEGHLLVPAGTQLVAY